MVSTTSDRDGLSPAERRALETSLRRAFDESTELDVRFHIRHALQLLSD
jgi:hypothetical protein